MMETIELTVPTSWNELTKRQLLTVASFIDMTLTREEVLFVLTCMFSGIKFIKDEGHIYEFVEVETNRHFALKDWQMKWFCDKMKWVLDTSPVDIVSPLGIDGHLNDVSFDDYFEADALFFKHRITGDTDAYWRAVELLGYKAWPKMVSRGMRLAVDIWWTGVQGYMKQLYPNVFSGDGDAEEYNPREAYQNIMLMLNDDRPQENEKIGKTNVHAVLAALDSKIQKAKQMEEQMRKGK